MKLAVCILACLSTAALAHTGQTAAADTAARDAQLHTRALAIVQAEQARAKQPLCPNAMTTLDINQCLAHELTVTDGNYVRFARVIGALLRSGAQSAPQRIPFDDAESAWQTYRDKACTADASQYDGGTIRPSIEMGCRLTLTRHHIDELWAIYSGLGTR